MIHQLKIYPQYLQALVNGKKTFEVRKNDRNYQIGDILEFKDGEFSDNFFRFRVSYIHSGIGMLPDYIVMSVQRIVR